MGIKRKGGVIHGSAFVDKRYATIDLPKVKIKFWDRINGHKTTFSVIGMLAGGILTLIPGLGILGKALFYTGCAGTVPAVIHKEGKESKFGESGKFNAKNFIEALINLFKVLYNLFITIKNRRK